MSEKVLVPALVGLDVNDAHQLAFEARVVVVGSDPDSPLPTHGVVIAQSPMAGVRVEPAQNVVVTVDPGPDDGGGGGGRPRTTPPPGPRDPAGLKPLG